MLKDKENRGNEKNKREKDRLHDLKSKVKTDIDHKNQPIAIQYHTFDLIAKKKGGYNKNPKTNSYFRANGFGFGPRFGLQDNEKWKNKVEKWNRNASENLIDPEKDATPGPGHYSLIEQWAKRKGAPVNLKKGSNMFFKMTSSGPSISPYYK